MYTKTIDKRKSLIKPPISKIMKSGCVVLSPGECVGEHCTDSKEEILVVLCGEASVQVENVTTILNKDMIGYIPEGKTHNVCNTSDTILKYIYIVSPV